MNLHYLNADFDVSLRLNPRSISGTAIGKTVKAMTLHGLLAAGEGDAVLLRAGIADDFPEYLESCSIPMPQTFTPPDIDRKRKLVPFGWNREAAEISRGQSHPAVHPDIEIVRRVNGRVFSAGLEKEMAGGDYGGAPFRDIEGLEGFLASSRISPAGWVVKADHGNSGLGNRRIRDAVLSKADRRFIAGALAEDDWVVLEPWQERSLDLTAVFHLTGRGAVEGFRVHEAVCTSDGALIGVLFAPGDHPWHGQLVPAAEKIGAALSREGYFGPVCFDAYTFMSEEGTRLRPLVDLNCRRAMSAGVCRLRDQMFSDRIFYWRFFSTDKLLPGTVAAVRASDMAYNGGKRRGVLFTSPWDIEIDGEAAVNPKLGVAFLGSTKGEVRTLEDRFRRQWEK